jgi:CRP-like cAMP-binding protein
MENGAAIEGATLGNEGMVGLEVFLGDGTTRDEIVVQIPGDGVRIAAQVFREAVAHSSALQRLLQRYALSLMSHLGRTAGCNRVHSVEARVARVLLMSQDRVGQSVLPLTHEVLATMLGIRRASVSESAETFRRAGLIDYRRGSITILDKSGLTAMSCTDYQLTSAMYDRLYAPS